MKSRWCHTDSSLTHAAAWLQVLTARQGAKLRRMTKEHNGVHAALCAQVNYSHCEESSSMVSEAGADAQAEHQRKAVTAVAKQPMKVQYRCPFWPSHQYPAYV